MSLKQITVIFLTLLMLVGAGAVIYKRIDFRQNCSGRLERAANANTVELAIKELDAAIQYAEAKGYTSGYTSVLYNTPDEDVEYWYNNLCASRNELLNLSDSTSTLEKTNTLMKLRETLTDIDKYGTHVIYPDGLQFYPNNILWGIIRYFILFVLLVIFVLIMLMN